MGWLKASVAGGPSTQASDARRPRRSRLDGRKMASQSRTSRISCRGETAQKKMCACRVEFGNSGDTKLRERKPLRAFSRPEAGGARGRVGRGAVFTWPRARRHRAPAPGRGVCNAARPPKILTRAPLPRVQSEEKGVPRLHRISSEFAVHKISLFA